MGAEDSIRKLKRKISALAQKEGSLINKEDRQGNKKIKKKNKSSVDLSGKVDAETLGQDETNKTSGGDKKSRKLRNKKIRNGKITRTRVEDSDSLQSKEVEGGISGKKHVEKERAEDKLQKAKKKKKNKRTVAESIDRVDEFNKQDDSSEQRNEYKSEDHVANSEGLGKADKRSKSKTGNYLIGGKSKKHKKIKKKNASVENDLSQDNLLESRREDAQDEVLQMSSRDEDYSKGIKSKSKKHKKTKKKNASVENDLSQNNLLESRGEDAQDKVLQMSSGDENYSKGIKSKSKKHKKIKKKNASVENDLSQNNLLESRGEDAKDEVLQMSSGDEDYSKGMKSKSKRHKKIKKKNASVENDLSQDNLLESRGEDAQDEVLQMSSGDEDYSKGMKKWITQYHQSRPGLKVLQERIDDFITAHEAQEEKARIEREAKAEEGGWTVVVHHKGRKKTTESETGIAVGSVAQAAVIDKMAKKKSKEVGIDFYRFQKREAHRNEIMMLQSKFEEDKKRIQQLRAARKFRPY